MVSPITLREPQYRGLAEPWYLEIAFEEIDSIINPTLVLNGWLQFGGGMANISGSLRKDFPFPFPYAEAWSPSRGWEKLDLDLGAPAGKTKTIIASLKNKHPKHSVARTRIAWFQKGTMLRCVYANDEVEKKRF